MARGPLLSVSNSGTAPLEIKVRDCPPWLDVHPNQLTVKVGRTRPFHLRDRRKPGERAAHGTIVFATNEPGKEFMTVSVTVPAKPKARRGGCWGCLVALVLLGAAALWAASHFGLIDRIALPRVPTR